jgi:hypothetical protein
MILLRPCCVVLVMVFAFVPAGLPAATSSPVSLITNAKNVIVWQEFHPWLMITEDLPSGRTCYNFSHVDRSKSSLKPAMPGDWSPIGSAIKWLFFIGYSNGLDRLTAHQVDYHQDFVIVPSLRRQVGCGMLGNTCVFGQYRSAMVGDRYPVDLYDYDAASAAVTPACISDSEKTQFAHDASLIVYRAHLGGANYAMCGHYFDLPGEFLIADRNGVEPSVCSPLVAWAEASGSGFDIVARNLETGELRTVAYTTADPPRPEAGRGAIFWQDSRNPSTAPDIYGYDLDSAQEFAVTTAAGSQSRLRVCDDIVTWVTGATNYQTLWAATIAAPARVADLRATQVTSSSVDLAWTSVGTSANPPTLYDLRTRTDGPLTDNNWESSTPVAGMAAPKPGGQAEAFSVQSLAQGPRWIGLKTRLQDGSYTPLSNVVCGYLSEASSCFSASDGSYVTFTGVVTGCEPDRSFYCQAAMGPRAVKVMPRTGEALVSVGQTVVVTGILAQEPESFGPVLRQAIVTGRIASGLPDVVAMCNEHLGGYDARWGGTAELGAPNFWMRVRTWGRVSGLTATSSGCSFCIADGSSLADNSGQGVLVISSHSPPAGLANGAFVVVDGICRVSRTSGRGIKIVSTDGIMVQW